MGEDGYNPLAIAALARTNSIESDKELLESTSTRLTSLGTALGMVFDGNGDVTVNGVDSRLSDLERKTVPSQGDDYTISYSDVGVLTSTTATITLPVHKEGYEVVIKKIDNVGIATIVPNGGLIDEQANVTLSSQWEFIRLLSDGTNWYKVG